MSFYMYAGYGQMILKVLLSSLVALFILIFFTIVFVCGCICLMYKSKTSKTTHVQLNWPTQPIYDEAVIPKTLQEQSLEMTENVAYHYIH